jgi:hypothetical protein
MVTSFEGLIDSLADANFTSDVLVLPPSIAVYDTVVGADETLAARLRELPEVEAVGSLRYASGVSGDQPLQVLGIDPVEYPKVASFVHVQSRHDFHFAGEHGSGFPQDGRHSADAQS